LGKKIKFKINLFKYALGAVFLILPALFIFAQYGSEPPEIKKVEILEVSENTAVVEWETNIETDATINYGLNDKHGTERYPYFDKKKHKITIDSLEPSTTYHFRVMSTDQYGNKSASGGFVFTTKGTKTIPEIETVKDEKERAVVEKTLIEIGRAHV